MNVDHAPLAASPLHNEIVPSSSLVVGDRNRGDNGIATITSAALLRSKYEMDDDDVQYSTGSDDDDVELDSEQEDEQDEEDEEEVGEEDASDQDHDEDEDDEHNTRIDLVQRHQSLRLHRESADDVTYHAQNLPMSPTSATVSGAVVASDSESSTSRQRRNIRRALGGRAARPSSVDGAGPPLSPILSSGATSLDTLTRFRSKSSLERASDKKETSAPDVLAPSAHSVLIHVHLADVDGQKLAAASQTGGTATDAHLDAADIGSLAGTTASTAGETVAGFMMPSPASPVADDAASHAGSGHSNATDHSDASTKDKRKPTYFQKLGIAFRAPKQASATSVGGDKLQTPATSHLSSSFKLPRRASNSRLRSTGSSTGGGGPEENLFQGEDETSTSTSYRKKSPRKGTAVGMGYVPITSKNKHYVELNRLRRVQLLAAGAGGLGAATATTAATAFGTGGGSVFSGGKEKEKAASMAGSETEVPHVPVSGAILAMRFCHGGRYLATGGADCIVRIFVVSGKMEANTESIAGGSVSAITDGKESAVPAGMASLSMLGRTQRTPTVSNTPPKPVDSPSTRSYSKPKFGDQNGLSVSAPSTVANSPEKHAAANFFLLHHTHYTTSNPDSPRVSSATPSSVANSQQQAQQQQQSNQILAPIAFRTLLGHTGPIHDLCWSKSQLLLSASTDKTVRLWHTLRAQALRVFTHDAPITGVRFHPQDDACFVSVAGAGPTRSRLRVWDVARGRVARWVDLAADVGVPGTSATAAGGGAGVGLGGAPGVGGGGGVAGGMGSATAGVAGVGAMSASYVTAVEFSQDGSLLITGTSDGGLYFHEYVDGELRYNTHLDLKAQANVKAFRVTGVECLGGDAAAGAAVGTIGAAMAYAEGDEAVVSGDGYVLVTATDSRIRLFNLRDKSLVRRYRGPDIKTLGTLKAVGSVDGRFAICGSEKGTVHVWDLDPNSYANKGVLTDIVGAAADLEDKKRAANLSAGGHDVGLGTGGSGSGAGKSNRFFSGLIQWQTDPGRYGEIFRGADFSVTCAAFAPPNVRSILGLDASAPDHHLSGAVIVLADVMGNIHVYENEPLPLLVANKSVQDLHFDFPASGDARFGMVSGSSNGTLPTGKRTIADQITSSPVNMDGSLQKPSHESSSISPSIDFQAEVFGRRLDDRSESDPFASEVFFLPKPSVKQLWMEDKPPVQFILSPSTDALPPKVTVDDSRTSSPGGLTVTTESPKGLRRRSYSSSSAFKPLFGSAEPSSMRGSVAASQEALGSLPLTRVETDVSKNRSVGKLGPGASSSSGAVVGNLLTKPTLIETLMHMRSHSKSVSASAKTMDASGTAGANPVAAAKGITGIFGRKRGATTTVDLVVGAHQRAVTSPPSSNLTADGMGLPVPPLLLPAKESLASKGGALKKSMTDLRRNGVSLNDLSSDATTPMRTNAVVKAGMSPDNVVGQQTAVILDENSCEDELWMSCKACGNMKFLVTQTRRVVCADCRTSFDL